MKKTYLLFALIICALTGCSSGSSDTSLNETNGLRRAAIMAQTYVKENFAADADFDDFDIRGGETGTPDRFKVFQKFTAYVDGREQTFIYKIYIQYYGGEWTDIANWDYGQLTVENCATGRKYYYNGGMKAKDAAGKPEVKKADSYLQPDELDLENMSMEEIDSIILSHQ